MRRGRQPALTILFVTCVQYRHDGGSKYLRTMFVGSRVHACMRAHVKSTVVRVRGCCVSVYDEIIRRRSQRRRRERARRRTTGKNIKFCRSDKMTALAIKYRGLCPLEKFVRGRKRVSRCVNLFEIHVCCHNGRLMLAGK